MVREAAAAHSVVVEVIKMTATENKKKLFSWILLWMLTAIYFFANLQKVIIPGATFNELQQKFAVNADVVTSFGAVFLGVYAAAQLVVGVLADRYGGIRVIIVGGFIFCAGCVLSAFELSLPLFYFSRFLTGCGAASIYLSMVKEIGRVAGNSMPMIIGIATIIGYSGSITGAAPFAAGVEKFGYFTMVITAGLAALFFYALYVLSSLKESLPPVKKDVKFSLQSYWSVFNTRQNCALIFAVGISFGTYFALQSTIGKKFLEDCCHFSTGAAASVMTVTMIIAAVNGFVMANISRMTGNRRHPTILFSGIGCGVGAAMILFGILLETSCIMPLCGMIIMSFAGNISPIYVALLKESNREDCFGTVVCVGNCLAYGISSLFSAGAGKLMDVFEPQMINNIRIYGRESYLLVFGVLTLLGIIAALLSFMVKESYGKDISR